MCTKLILKTIAHLIPIATVIIMAAADLAGSTNYEGYTYYDAETGEFKLNGYGTWAGNYGSSEFIEQFVNWDNETVANAWAETKSLVGVWIEE